MFGAVLGHHDQKPFFRHEAFCQKTLRGKIQSTLRFERFFFEQKYAYFSKKKAVNPFIFDGLTAFFPKKNRNFQKVIAPGLFGEALMTTVVVADWVQPFASVTVAV